MDSDDYWEKSDVKGFNFAEVESNGKEVCGFPLDGAAKLSQQIRDGIKTDDKFNFDSFSGSFSQASLRDRDKGLSQPELCNIISEKSLNAILEADNVDYGYVSTLKSDEELTFLRRQVQNRWVPPTINTTIRKIFLGQPHTLELYQSLNSKKELLKAAIELGDGDAILEVVLFLSQTLKKSLFHQLLASSPVAVNHYVNYLSIRMQTQKLSEILKMLGKNKDASMKQFSVACQDPQKQLEKLQQCSRNHFSNIKDKVLVDNYIKLLEWQKEIGVKEIQGQSVVNSLAYACDHHWNESKGVLASPQTLVQQQDIVDKQFQWVAFLSRAKFKAWDDLEHLFITKGWLGAKKLKAILPMDQVVIQLHKLEAPSNVIITYLELIDNVEKRLALARKLDCHRAVLDIYTSQRDRQSLLNYKANLPAQSEDYFYAEHLLRSNTKWKN